MIEDGPKNRNPDGINFDIAYDFVETAMKARHKEV